MLPSEAIMTIDILESYCEGSNLHHVAFILGLSRKHLVRLKGKLELASRGDPEACEMFNSRIPVMRNLSALHRLIELDPDYIKSILDDAKLWSDPKRNILHRRGGKEVQLSGLTEVEKEETVLQFLNYVEN
jgi:hypothetical protein